jgi:hypothetical protein
MLDREAQLLGRIHTRVYSSNGQQQQQQQQQQEDLEEEGDEDGMHV